ncbi:MAG: hypothetical protein IID41_11010 [Planctomycetes bacterium]|nr:hypothetical protein [Planctomycetota bacterium]
MNKLVLSIDPLLKSGIGRSQIIAALASGLAITKQVAALRLDRALSSGTESLRRDVLGQLFRMADDLDVKRGDLLRLEAKSLFDVLPDESTLTYLGGYGPVADDGLTYVDNITASVADYRSARLFARRITRDFSARRFAPSVGGNEDAIVERLTALASESQRRSLLSIGSSKINTMSEWLMARALGLTPFSSWAAAQGKPPVEFVFAVSDAQRKAYYTRNSTRCNSRFKPARDIEHSYLIWNETEYRYAPPSDPSQSGERRGRSRRRNNERGDFGIDYAVVFVEVSGPRIGNLVVCGLKAIGTFGASSLLCHDPGRFELSDCVPDVRLFLVEVRLQQGVMFSQPREARVVAHWTKSSGEFGKPTTDAFSTLGIVSEGLEPGGSLSAQDDRDPIRAGK